MTGEPVEPRDEPSSEELAYVASHLPEIRRRLAGNEILYLWIGSAFVLGLIAYAVGFVWVSNATDTLSSLLADLLRNLGTALWTGCVLALFVQVLPEVQRRSAIRKLRDYEARIEAEEAGRR